MDWAPTRSTSRSEFVQAVTLSASTSVSPCSPRRPAASASLDLPVTFEVGDAQALRFPDYSFDAVRTERMLMHVPDSQLALCEMARALRPGGRMSVHDFDWETQFCDSPYKETTRKIANRTNVVSSHRHQFLLRSLTQASASPRKSKLRFLRLSLKRMGPYRTRADHLFAPSAGEAGKTMRRSGAQSF
jgi:SAM-dependent methyltransferase